MAEGIRALGKVSISQVDKNDLTTTDEMYARALDIPLIYEPYNGETVPVKVRKIKL